MNKSTKIIIIILLFFISIIIANSLKNTNQPSTQPTPNPHWPEEYANELVLKGISPEFTKYTALVDYESITVQNIVKDIKSKAYSAEDAALMAAEYVYQNVKYNPTEQDYLCLQSTGTQIINSKTGQCDTQSRALVTILRGLGIASTPVAGCVSVFATCQYTQAVTGMRLPQFVPVTESDLLSDNASRAGGLHTWVKAYFPEKGWVDIEATAGQYINRKCSKYLEEYIPKTVAQECLSFDKNFIEECRKL
jgi:transglutaminase-like putative cysteine protease